MKNLKSVIIMLVISVLCCTLCSCGKYEKNPDLETNETNASSNTEDSTNKKTSETEKAPSDEEQAPQSEISDKTDDEMSYLHINITRTPYNKAELLNDADLIIRGTVVSKNGYTMTNPDGTVKDSMGHVINNCMLTEFTVSVDDVYKGEYEGNTINIDTSKGDGLSPNLILHGVDGNVALGEPLEDTDLKVGKEYILLLSLVENSPSGDDGYRPIGGLRGCYLKTENAGFLCQGSGATPDNGTLKADSVSEEIAKAKQELSSK